MPEARAWVVPCRLRQATPGRGTHDHPDGFALVEGNLSMGIERPDEQAESGKEKPCHSNNLTNGIPVDEQSPRKGEPEAKLCETMTGRQE
jgi:hypothetical protein